MLSRRDWLVLLSGLAGISAIGRGRAAETQPQKVSKEIAKYQDHPNTMQMCGMCKFYIPPGGQPGHGMMGGEMGGSMMGKGQTGTMRPGTCQLVEGTINPMGWCQLYQPVSTQRH